MMHAYDEIYTGKAQAVMGQMLRYAEEDLQIGAGPYFEMFLASGIAGMLGKGDYRYIVGMSGPEVAREVFWRMRGIIPDVPPSCHLEKSPVYWAGWSLAYYQWYTGQSFQRIHDRVKLEEICGMYSPYHEMDLLQFVDAMDAKMRSRAAITRLKMYRERLGMSQGELAGASDTSVRMIQNYEQRQKDLGHAQADTVKRLARALNCSMEDLLEE